VEATDAADIPLDAGFRLDFRGAVATITLNRPERLNAQTPVTWTALAAAGQTMPADVRVVVLRGEGRSFSAGLDRSVFQQLNAGTLAMDADAIKGFQAGFGWLARPDIVSIAVVQGHAIGAGFQLALACDIRLAVQDVQFAMAETSLGLVPDLGGTKRIVELVGYSRAAELCLTGRRIRAEEALRIGLVSMADTAEAVEIALEATVRSILAAPPSAVSETKALLLAASARTQDEQELAEREAQSRRLQDLSSPDSSA
jgi:enoyl-CoA hydratase/carnithine racemase